MVGASTRNPQKRVEAQKRFPQAVPPRTSESPVMDASTPSGGLAACLPTPSAVSAAAFQRSASVPRRRNSTDSMLGRARPMKQAGIQMAHWSRTTCRYQRRQRGSDSRFTSNTDPTWERVMPWPPTMLGMAPTWCPMPQPWSRVKLLMGVLLSPPLPAMAAMAAMKAIRVKSMVGRAPLLNQDRNTFSTLGPSRNPSPSRSSCFSSCP